MKKIPTLFEREFKDHKVVKGLLKVHPGMEWVLEGKGTATVKWDGSCCMIANGNLFKRYDANIKKGKKFQMMQSRAKINLTRLQDTFHVG